jgi:BCD family chlorophyll transporter-like MFS transporter
VLLAARVAENRRPAAASLVWIMMIAGFVVTTAGAGQLLDPYSPQRLVAVSALVCGIAFVLALVAVAGIEGPSPARAEAREKVAFREALAQVWSEPEARRFTVFVFVSMLAYSAQDLILEPFAGIVFGLSLGGSTKLAAMQHAGVLLGMILVALLGSLKGGASLAALRATMVGGCLLAAAMLFGIAAGGFAPEAFPLRWSYLALGLGDGIFAAAAIATMMLLAGRGRVGRAGMRMGLWGASQAIAFGVGGLAGAASVDLARLLLGTHAAAYAAVFSLDALLFLASGLLALGIGRAAAGPKASRPPLHPTHGQGGLRA